MSLMSEIQLLRAQIDAHAPRTAPPDAPAAESAAPQETVADGLRNVDAEAFLKAVQETIDEFGDELDRFPRLSALAALGVGLAVGVVIGRQIR